LKKAILTLNSGSSSIKFSIFSIENGTLTRECKGLIDNILKKPSLHIKCSEQLKTFDWETSETKDPYEYAVHKIVDSVQQDFELVAAGHRVVHGGIQYNTPILIDDENLAYLNTLSPLAALHQPYNLKGIRILRDELPKLPQIACFDTSFHTTCHKLSQMFAIPKKLTEQGIKRYGFHGLSYEYIVSKLGQYLPSDKVNGKIIIAHLGSGVSMCGIHHKQSVSISIGFSVLDGLPMGTRCGSIDPGVLLHLMSNYHMDYDALFHLLYKESGLLGVSGGMSSDMRELLQSDSEDAKRAVDLFVYRVSTWIGTLAAELQGLDAIIFTAGIGENSPEIRERVCRRAAWLGVEIDQPKNLKNSVEIHHQNSKILVYAIPTDEELMIAAHTYQNLM
jgi:acetate kinase